MGTELPHGTGVRRTDNLVFADGHVLTWTEASKLIGAFCRKASAGVSSSLLHGSVGVR